MRQMMKRRTGSMSWWIKIWTPGDVLAGKWLQLFLILYVVFNLITAGRLARMKSWPSTVRNVQRFNNNLPTLSVVYR